ncbi:hypothetical protein VNO77_10760 [Canavalia gladiata]|uniref:Uncharacterized protein n=1 Tax=Canavalia gladiata TaxID=3824 RepID=A0AAN9QUX6_CANGL
MGGNPSKVEEMIGALNCVEDYDYEDMVIITYCGCFRGLYSTHGYEWCHGKQETVKDHRKWLAQKLKKMMKALSDVLVCPSCTRTNNKKRKMQFQYDPKSYALNFDDGVEKEDDGLYLHFSDRYACPLGINKL